MMERMVLGVVWEKFLYSENVRREIVLFLIQHLRLPFFFFFFSLRFWWGGSCVFVFLPTLLIYSKTSVPRQHLRKWVTCCRVGQLQGGSHQLNCTCRVKRWERLIMVALRTNFLLACLTKCHNLSNASRLSNTEREGYIMQMQPTYFSNYLQPAEYLLLMALVMQNYSFFFFWLRGGGIDPSRKMLRTITWLWQTPSVCSTSKVTSYFMFSLGILPEGYFGVVLPTAFAM